MSSLTPIIKNEFQLSVSLSISIQGKFRSNNQCNSSQQFFKLLHVHETVHRLFVDCGEISIETLSNKACSALMNPTFVVCHYFINNTFMGFYCIIDIFYRIKSISIVFWEIENMPQNTCNIISFFEIYSMTYSLVHLSVI